MPSSDERAKVIANNRSLRIIKNELEALAERDFISDEQYDLILRTLPAEASLHNANVRRSSTTASSVADGFSSMSINDRNPSSATTPKNQPPPYSDTPAPLPPRNQQQQPQRHEIAHVVALYRYNDPDPRDLTFEAGDHISVTEYCNAEWGNGKNVRTGEEGIFPRNYVRVEPHPSPLAQPPQQQPQQPQQPSYNEKQGGGGYFGGYAGPSQQGYMPPPPGPSSPYDGPVPPMQMADQPMERRPGRGAEMGKKFGKKLGNAAIFGAGATLGGDLVNSIF